MNSLIPIIVFVSSFMAYDTIDFELDGRAGISYCYLVPHIVMPRDMEVDTDA